MHSSRRQHRHQPFRSSRAYDAAGNVWNAWTRVPQGNDTQAFCYDDLNRLVWASAKDTPTCSGPSMTPGSLTAAQYTRTFSYDNLNRIVTVGSSHYLYADSAHLHAATSTTATASYTYDAVGDMTCRAPNSGTVCGGASPTGAQLAYNAQGQLSAWQNAPTSPTSTDSFLYDGEGTRAAQQTVVGGTTTTTVYVGDLEEVATSGSTTTTTTYYYAAGQRIALAVNGVFSYLGDDGLGSSSVALSATGVSQGSELYMPFGGGRWGSGTMPTRRLFTGQLTDSVTGLDYYNARYYDPALGQFVSADTYDAGGLNRYAYVDDNPTTRTDPSGHCWPVCGLIIGLAAAVVTTVADAAVQTIQNGGDMSKVDWGQAVEAGVVVGVTTAAVLTLGPEVLGIEGAGSAAIAADVGRGAVGAVAGGLFGAAEGFGQGVANGESGGHLLRDTLIGAGTGAAGGFIGGMTGNPVLANVAGAAVSNFATQALQAKAGGPKYFNSSSFGASLAWAAIGGQNFGPFGDLATAALGPWKAGMLITGGMDFGDFLTQLFWQHLTQPFQPQGSRGGDHRQSHLL